MSTVPTKRVWEATPRMGTRFVVLGTDYAPAISIFTAFDKKFLRSCGWASTHVKS